jgi:hypothetical protein
VASIKTLVNFNGTNGADPEAGLITDITGDLFGTTQAGGTNHLGTVFEILKTTSGYAASPTVLFNFDGGNGARPVAGLIADAETCSEQRNSVALTTLARCSRS